LAPPVTSSVSRSTATKIKPNTLLLIVLVFTFICFFPIFSNDFLNFDDPQYVTDNPAVQQLNAANFKSYFTQSFVGNYQPIVILSYAIQYKLFSGHAWGFHFFSLLMHLLNTALVFFLAKRLLNNDIGAMITAMLFGIHPLHVESVAWVASQKDVLYTFFFLTSSMFYLRYRSAPRESRMRDYLLAMIMFALSLLSKAQAVVLPVVFILFDMLMQWREQKAGTPGDEGHSKARWTKLIPEKIPFFLLSLIFGGLAVKMQASAGAMQDFGYFKVYERVLFACYGFVMYWWQTFFPVRLGIFYPYPETDGKINSQLVYLAPVLILLLAAAVFYFRKKLPVLLFGFLFFCVTIALVIQLIPVGDAIHADRYTYISLLGLFLFAGYLFGEYFLKYKNQLTLGAGIYFAVLGFLTFQRAQVFHDSVTVYADSLKNHPAAIIYSNLGAEYYKEAATITDQGSRKEKFAEALDLLIKCRELKSNFPRIWFNCGLAHAQVGNADEAIKDYTHAVMNDKADFNSYFQRAGLYSTKNKVDSALSDYSMVIQLNPGILDAWFYRGVLYQRNGKLNEALADFNHCIQVKPDFTDAYLNRAITYGMAGKSEAALADFNSALAIDPHSGNVYFNRSLTYKMIGRFTEALNDALAAQQNNFQLPAGYLDELHKLAGK
ncbi:MAG TPA: tetratricopeptide repeat protein, partial [Bacteroidia bacterium]